LIELLIVVAIIAILAAIAVPNFLEAQVRAKASRSYSDMRSLATAIEAYNVDYSDYPPVYVGGTLVLGYTRLNPLTTPVAYITTLPNDPFWSYKLYPGWPPTHPCVYPFWDPAQVDGQKASATGLFRYMQEERMRKGRWLLFGCGPDRDNEASVVMGGSGYLYYYDPSNGTVSDGDIYRFGP